MSISYAELEKVARELVAQGISDNDLILRLHQLGASILESIKIFRSVRGVSLGIAKETVSSHESWREVVEESRTLHEEAIMGAKQAAEQAHRRSKTEP